ncbi:hypothetical protein STEG23_010462 [Scotinomys teguina]
MPCCGKHEQDSVTFEMLQLEKCEWRITSGLRHLGKVRSKQSNYEQQRQLRPDCFQDCKSGVSARKLLRHAGAASDMEDSRPDFLNIWNVSSADFLDNETCLLLAALIYFKEKNGH